jgi:hypothetical protein
MGAQIALAALSELLGGSDAAGRQLVKARRQPSRSEPVGDFAIRTQHTRFLQAKSAIEWVEAEIQRLLEDGEVEVRVSSLGHRSAFVGAGF